MRGTPKLNLSSKKQPGEFMESVAFDKHRKVFTFRPKTADFRKNVQCQELNTMLRKLCVLNNTAQQRADCTLLSSMLKTLRSLKGWYSSELAFLKCWGILKLKFLRWRSYDVGVNTSTFEDCQPGGKKNSCCATMRSRCQRIKRGCAQGWNVGNMKNDRLEAH